MAFLINLGYRLKFLPFKMNAKKLSLSYPSANLLKWKFSMAVHLCSAFYTLGLTVFGLIRYSEYEGPDIISATFISALLIVRTICQTTILVCHREICQLANSFGQVMARAGTPSFYHTD